MVNYRFLTLKGQYLQNHLRTPQCGEPEPPINRFHLEFELLITFQLHDLWPAHQIFGPTTPQKIPKLPPSGPKKGDPQTRERRVRGSSRAHFVHKSDSLGVLVQPKEGSGDDFGDTSLTVQNFGQNFSKGIFTKISQCEAHISKIASRPLLGLNQDPQWIGFVNILSPYSCPNSTISGL